MPMDEEDEINQIRLKRGILRLERYVAKRAGKLEDILLEQKQHSVRVNPWRAMTAGVALCVNCAVLPVRDPDEDFVYTFCDPCARINEGAAQAIHLPTLAPYRRLHDGVDLDVDLLNEELGGDIPIIELVNWHEMAEVMTEWRAHNITHLSMHLGVAGWPDVPREIWEQPLRHGSGFLSHRFVETLFAFAPNFTLAIPDLADPEFHATFISRTVGDKIA